MAIEQMNVSITTQLARYVRGKVQGGRYTNASEVVREALRLLQKREALDEARIRGWDLDNLSPEEIEGHARLVGQGERAISNGEYQEYDEPGLKQLLKDISARGRRRLAAERKKSA